MAVFLFNQILAVCGVFCAAYPLAEQLDFLTAQALMFRLPRHLREFITDGNPQQQHQNKAEYNTHISPAPPIL